MSMSGTFRTTYRHWSGRASPARPSIWTGWPTRPSRCPILSPGELGILDGMTELRWLGVGDEDAVLAAGQLFDDLPSPQWTADFLAKPGHHLCVAYVDDVPAGFVSGVEMCHPDKGTEMCLYELGVDEAYRRRGIGRALTTAL